MSETKCPICGAEVERLKRENDASAIYEPALEEQIADMERRLLIADDGINSAKDDNATLKTQLAEQARKHRLAKDGWDGAEKVNSHLSGVVRGLKAKLEAKRLSSGRAVEMLRSAFSLRANCNMVEDAASDAVDDLEAQLAGVIGAVEAEPEVPLFGPVVATAKANIIERIIALGDDSPEAEGGRMVAEAMRGAGKGS